MARFGRQSFRGYSGGRGYSNEPPSYLFELGEFQHPCEGEAVCKLITEKIPFFNAPIFEENKVQIGKVDEIFGLIKSPMFTVKLNEGIVATSYTLGHKFYTDPAKLLPLERFLPSASGKGTSGGRGRGIGGRGRGRGGRGGGRGPMRGRFISRGGRFRGRSFSRGRGR